MLNLIQRAQSFSSNIAIQDPFGSYTYAKLINDSNEFAGLLLDGKSDLEEERIGFLISPGYDYVKVQWAIWLAGGIAVPIHPKAPHSSIEYILEDTEMSQLVCEAEYLAQFKSLADSFDIRLLSTQFTNPAKTDLPEIQASRRAMILYTSGTTGAPKGVVTTHSNIEAQISCLVSFWEWSSEDHIINVLPMHHVHGIINVLSCALWSGARCEFMPFDAEKVMKRLVSREVNLFMAVPTIYFKLISYWDSCSQASQKKFSEGLQKMRLMVSGSAALPVSVLEKWKEISGHTLLERYGMTEIGMAVSNSYRGARIPGHIGQALPGVELKLVNEDLIVVSAGEDGEILIKGPSVFKEYWGRKKATKEAFTSDGWFKTGDIAVFNGKNLKIIGRSSIDIIKSGGYKLSALEIEETLRQHPSINDCAVVGVEDEEWGEIVAVGLVLENINFDLEEFQTWMKSQLSGYKVPRLIEILEDLPRNAMGKVVKKELKVRFKSSL